MKAGEPHLICVADCGRGWCCSGGFLASLLAIALLPTLQARAIEVWDGPIMGFTNYTGSDPTDPASQDRITPNIWITRGSLQGIYNIALEPGYTHSLSPVGTEWAYGELANYASLSYTDWEDWFGGRNGGGPPSTVGRDAVMHILPGDIYLSVQFTSWVQQNGGFSYNRSTPPTPEPSSGMMILAGLAILAIHCSPRHRRSGNRQSPESGLPATPSKAFAALSRDP
jgi:hypothetical protein